MIALVICILKGSNYVIALSKAFLVFAFKICLRHQSVTKVVFCLCVCLKKVPAL